MIDTIDTKVALFPQELAFDTSRRCLLSERTRNACGIKVRGDAVVVRHNGNQVTLWAHQGRAAEKEDLLIYLNPPTREELGIGGNLKETNGKDVIVKIRRAGWCEVCRLRWCSVERIDDVILGIILTLAGGGLGVLITWLFKR
jgi:hypothetical protein